MNCKDIHNQISQADGASALSPDAQAHVAKCEVCARSVTVARVQRLLLNAVARQPTPEPVFGFEQRVLARASESRPDGATASLIGRLAWQLTPALAVVIVALAVMGITTDAPTDGGLTTLVSQLETVDDGWATELAQMFSVEQTAEGTR